jgi:peptidyl-prolyl cis-trans isomerase D
MISDRALEYEATQLGFQVTDQDVATAVRQLLPAELFPEGRFLGKEAYAMVLAQRNLTIGEYEADVRRQILIHRLLDVAVEGSVVTDLEIEQTFKVRNEKIRMQYVKLVSDKYKQEAEPSLADMQRYFTATANQYQVPAQRGLAILYLDPAKLMESINPSDNELQTAYKQNLEQFRVGERVKVRHILLKTQGKPASEEPKVKAQADDILHQVKGGAKFADLVEKFSEDPGSKASAPNREPGLGPGEYWVEKNGQMVPEFQNAAFTLKPGQSDVVKTTYGYHVFQVVEHQDARVKPYDEVKADLAKQWKAQYSEAAVQTASEKAETALRADPTHPDKVAAGLNMRVIRVDRYEAGQTVPELGSQPEFQNSVQNLKTGEVGQAVSLSGNKLAVAVVTGAVPARQKTFEEAQTEVHDKMAQVRLAAAMQRHVQEFYDRAKLNNDLEGVAKSMGFEVKTSEESSRSGTIKDLDTGIHFQEGFKLPDGSVFGPIPLASGTVVAKVIAHIAPDLSTLPAERAKIRDEIKGQKAKDRNDLFEAGVLSELERRGVIKRHKDVLDLLVTSYLSKG